MPSLIPALALTDYIKLFAETDPTDNCRSDGPPGCTESPRKKRAGDVEEPLAAARVQADGETAPATATRKTEQG